MPPRCVAVVNRVPYLVDDKAEHVELMVQAVQTQVEEHLAPAWGLEPLVVKLFADGADVPKDAAFVYLVNKLDESPGAAGRHMADEARGHVGFVAVEAIQRMGGTLTTGSDSVSSALSHEICELIVNPSVNLWADTGDGLEVALEVCDPVSSDYYDIEVAPLSVATCSASVSVSNFVLPAWFDPISRPTDKLDYLGLLSKPFAHRAGGYVSEREKGQERLRFGDKVPAEVGRRLLSHGRRARARARQSVVA